MPTKKSDLDYSQVIESIKKKVPVLATVLEDPEVLEDLLIKLRRHSFFVSKLNKISQIRYVQNSLAQAIEEGLTFKQWKERVSDEQTGIFKKLESLSKSRLETVYRTNIAQATEDGSIRRAVEMGDFVMFSAVLDSRNRPSHGKLNGLVLKATDQRISEIRTPLDFNCRCSWIAISKRRAKESTRKHINQQLKRFKSAGGAPASFAKNTTQDAASIRRYLNARSKKVGIKTEQVRELEKRQTSEFKRHASKVMKNISGDS